MGLLITPAGGGTGTVTSVGGTGTVSGLTLTGTVTSSGDLTLGGTLSVAASNFASQSANTFLAAPNGAAGTPTFRAIVAADIPTLNQNTTGTASNVTGTVAIANGGTGATTAAAARTNLGASTLGSNLFTLTNPSAITFPRINADNTVSALDAATFRTAIGAGTSSFTGASITDDTTTNASRYIVWEDVSSGTSTAVGVSSTKLYFNPSTGTLNATVFNSLSDGTQKENIVPIKNALNTISSITGVEFDWASNNKHSAGVVAQQLESILPFLVDTNDSGIKSVNYSGIIAYLIQAIKELSQEVKQSNYK